MSDTTYDETCPACGEELRDLWETLDPNKGDTEFECDHCGASLIGIAEVDITYMITGPVHD